ncbi:hypothetical protein ABZZ79_04280 [Streptomyces sp. NPDC006458]|uniref:hypothetical protein n=1 Tax=Streptomyces sp. NPDC006458 TaxID=3154302 RepID=UPI0033AB9C86
MGGDGGPTGGGGREAEGGTAGGGGRRSAARRGAADPVKALMHRHRELCERAVDPLEIAAGLEAHGVTDRTAARFRHRDVFSLAEEMYARVPRDADTRARAVKVPALPAARAGWALRALVPGALCTAAVAGLRLTDGQSRLLVAVAGVLALVLGVRFAAGRGPLRVHRPRSAPRPVTGVWTGWLVGYAALGDGLLRSTVTGGPDTLPNGAYDGPWPLATASLLALALACAPGAWCAHLFAAEARRRLTASRGLEEFASAVRPLLLGSFALFLGALAALLVLCGEVLDEAVGYAQILSLGGLLLLARLLAAHGFTHAPAAVLTACAAAEGAALGTVFAGRLPGCGFLSVPVEELVSAWGPGSAPALICAAGALTLLIHAGRTLTLASAHAEPVASR